MAVTIIYTLFGLILISELNIFIFTFALLALGNKLRLLQLIYYSNAEKLFTLKIYEENDQKTQCKEIQILLVQT